MTIADRIKSTRIKQGLSQNKLATLVGVSRSAVHQWEQDGSGTFTEPSAPNLLRCAAILRVDPEWLQFGIRTFLPTGHKNQYQESEFPGTINKLPVLYTSRHIKEWARSPHTFISREEITMPNLNDSKNPKFVFRVIGSAMINQRNYEESVFPGEYAVIERREEIKDGDIVLAEFGHDDLRLRQYRKDGAQASLRAFDREIKAVDVNHEINIIGKLVGSYREKK